MTLKIRKQDVDDQRDLVSTGDQDLTLIKQMFATRMGRATTLDDEKLLIACACHTDDDDVLLCAIIKQVETGDYEVIEKTEIAAE